MTSFHDLLGDSRFHSLLLRIDTDFAQRTRKDRCGFCDSALHSARYPRLPRGAPLSSQDSYRFSFCCSREGCRRRTTPPSVRFLGRHVYLGIVVVLVTALRQGPTPRGRRILADEFDVDERTIRRWQLWWRETFPRTAVWKEMKARLNSDVVETEIPLALVECFGAFNSRDGLARLLVFLAPLSATLFLSDFARFQRITPDPQTMSWSRFDDPN